MMGFSDLILQGMIRLTNYSAALLTGGIDLDAVKGIIVWGVGLLGGVSIVWGVIQLANAIREGGGSGTAQGIGGIVAGAIIIAAAAIFGNLDFTYTP